MAASLSSCQSPKLCRFLLTLACLNCLIAIASARVFIAQVKSTGPALSPYYLVNNLSIGTPPQPQQLLLSIDATSYPWLQCTKGHSQGSFNPKASSSFQYLQCGRYHRPCIVHFPAYPLTVLPPDPLAGLLATDTFLLHSTDGSSQGPFSPIPKIKLACVAPNRSIKVPGVAAMSASKDAIPAQLVNKGIYPKFAYCLPSPGQSVPGPVFFGDNVSYMFGSPPIMNISAFLAFTPLLQMREGEYYIAVGGIKVDGAAIPNPGKTLNLAISSVQSYTRLERRWYTVLRERFREAAKARNISAAPAVAPFDTCFDSTTIGFSRVGLVVPAIELDLVRGQVWQIFGSNSMVMVSDSVACLGFVDAGPGQPSVLGTSQQQNNLLEFDLRKKRLGFSGVLFFFRTSCVDFNF